MTGAFVLEVMVQLTLGVAHLHSCGILHRDLKADNAFIQARDPLVIKWGDFGCAVQLGKNCYGDGMYTLSWLRLYWQLGVTPVVGGTVSLAVLIQLCLSP